jgi:L-aspartate oxidase
MRVSSDYLVLGSGIAGLTFALEAAKHGQVAIVTKRAIRDSNTNYAQAGIAAVMDPADSFDAHVSDTLVVGCGLSKPDVVQLVVENGPDRIRELMALGATFDLKNGPAENGSAFDLTREGGHTARRVVHAGDVTGREVQRVLVEAVHTHPNIRVFEQHMAVDLIELSKFGGPHQVAGAYVLDEAKGEVHTFVSRATVLATGGAGKVYLYTSNPDVATGDGVAMAYRIGAACCDLEFVQFHPTVLYHPHAGSFLISEALRGEGGVLRLATGETFMENYHPMKSLAPRDFVARAIDNELKKSGADSVFLDMTHLDAAFVRGRFPNIHERCLSLGIDITKQPIPVVPAAHYMCGGIKTDEHGATTIRGLYAIGESAFTGLHGANRLASNSLLEAMVFSARAAAAVREVPRVRPAQVATWSSGNATDSNDAIVVTLNWDEIRRFMWSYVGIVRSDKRLERARRRIEILRDVIREYYIDFKVTPDLLELRNLALVAHLIIESARRRKESRGLHYTLDYPDKLPEARHSEIQLTDGPRG